MASPVSEIAALVRLLDDPDETVQERVRSRLEELGRDALPALRAVREDAGPEVRDQIDAVVHDLHLADVRRAWNAVLGSESVDLERGAFLLALYRFPTLDVEAYRERLDALADAARPAVEAADGGEQALALAQVLGEEHGFDGNRENYYDPNNSYLNRVLDRRTGIPISLSVVYLLVAGRLDLPMCGVNMPAHFLVRYADGRQDLLLDPFNGGQVVSRETCVRVLLRAGIRPAPAYFDCAPAKAILLRMVRNLRTIAENAGQTATAEELRSLAEPWEPDDDAPASSPDP
jgi:regulator of sirC expression with transglutaminase-like and TPR domain